MSPTQLRQMMKCCFGLAICYATLTYRMQYIVTNLQYNILLTKLRIVIFGVIRCLWMISLPCFLCFLLLRQRQELTHSHSHAHANRLNYILTSYFYSSLSWANSLDRLHFLRFVLYYFHPCLSRPTCFQAYSNRCVAIEKSNFVMQTRNYF